MDLVTEINNLSLSEKLMIMEELWSNLSTNAEKEITPEWHDKVLSEREANYKAGSDNSYNWSDAKSVLRDRLK